MNLPILDLQAYEKDKSTFLKNLREIASKIGFFYLINTSIDKNLKREIISNLD
ncbi:isopenicillin N synthase family oxygenase, partial [Campylobacter jejuni]|nr:isopenicillin N synthase family oxygenase [Campylobacter jejuni]